MLLILEKKRHWGELTAAFQGLVSVVKEARDGLFTRACVALKV